MKEIEKGDKIKQRLMKIKLNPIFIAGALVTILGVIFLWFYLPHEQKEIMNKVEISLPPPHKASNTSLEEVLWKRRSIRDFKQEAINLKEVSQLLWAAQGITDPSGKRTAPSAGALYPLEVYLVARDVEELEPGVYKYVPKDHKLIKILKKDISQELAQAALGQSHVQEASANLVFTAVFKRTADKYGERGIRYVYMEVGHASENVYLQAESLDLGTVSVGAFHDEELKSILTLAAEETPLYIMPVGRR